MIYSYQDLNSSVLRGQVNFIYEPELVPLLYFSAIFCRASFYQHVDKIISLRVLNKDDSNPPFFVWWCSISCIAWNLLRGNQSDRQHQYNNERSQNSKKGALTRFGLKDSAK